MKTLLAFFTSNWGLKILALILAIVVYYSLKETTTKGHGKQTMAPLLSKGTANGGK